MPLAWNSATSTNVDVVIPIPAPRQRIRILRVIGSWKGTSQLAAIFPGPRISITNVDRLNTGSGAMESGTVVIPTDGVIGGPQAVLATQGSIPSSLDKRFPGDEAIPIKDGQGTTVTYITGCSSSACECLVWYRVDG